jgi:uncharacterized protein YhbP (UPF0306 family)
MTGESLSETDQQALIALLEETPVLTLATLHPNGSPRATPLYFAHRGLTLVFLSDPASLHCQNLQADRRCAVALYPPVTDWRQLRGVQMRGTAALVDGAEAAAALNIFALRFPFVGQLPQALAQAKPYRFTPDWARRIDNRQGFGFQQEWSLRA